MTTYDKQEEKCYLCGKESMQQVIMSSSQYREPDLDSRPALLMRATMPDWIHECPSCGYCARNLSDKTDVNLAWLKTKEYRDSMPKDLSSLAKQFYKFALIQTHDGNKRAAFRGFLEAAWECDDNRDRVNARHCRLKALEMLNACINQEADEAQKEELHLIKMDILRRTRQFDVLIKNYEKVVFSTELHQKLRRFQLEKAKEHEDKCYRISDMEKQ